MRNITPLELIALLRTGEAVQLVDVRERYEHEEFNIGGILLPLSEITRHLAEIDQHKTVVLYCRIGIRSQVAIQRLQDKFPFGNLVNLAGGMEAWKKQVSTEAT